VGLSCWVPRSVGERVDPGIHRRWAVGGETGPVTATAASPAPSDLTGLRVPKTLHEDVARLVALTDALCREHLDEEYGRVCRDLVGMLARKRPSPLVRGDLAVWAATVVYTVGSNNFLFDRSSTPHLSTDQLAAVTGVAKQTMANKARSVRNLLGIELCDIRLCRRELIERHPYAWYVEVGGLVVDVRGLPPHIQEEARRRGLVPDLAAVPSTGS
jgi:hypothetical protein